MTFRIIFIYFLLLMIFLLLTFPIRADSKGDRTRNHDGDRSIAICCSWGAKIEDEKLTYSISDASNAIQNAAITAAEEWDSKLENVELEKVKDFESPDITIVFKKDTKFLPVQTTKYGTLPTGVNIHKLDPEGFIQNVGIIIAKGFKDQAFSLNEIKLIVEHEIGHALGLGHSNFQSSIMFPKIGSDQLGMISACEVNAVLYANAWRPESGNLHSNFSTDQRLRC